MALPYRSRVTLVELMMGAVVLLMLSMFCVKGCSGDSSEAVRALETNGFSNVSIQDSGVWGVWHGCDKHDGAWYDASATNPIGKKVDVVVCCGGPLSFKGCTVRTR